jgi:hypothetical protein
VTRGENVVENFGLAQAESDAELVDLLNEYSLDGAPSAPMQQTVAYIRQTLLPAQVRSDADVQVLVLLVLGSSQVYTSGLRSELQALREAGAHILTVLLPSPSGMPPSGAQRSLAALTSSTPASQHVFAVDNAAQLTGAEGGKLGDRALCRAALTAWALDMGAAALTLTFSRHVLPASLRSGALTLVSDSGEESYVVRQAAAAPARPAALPPAGVSRRQQLVVALPSADVAALRSQRRLAQSVDSTNLQATEAALRLAGYDALWPSGTLKPATLVGARRPFVDRGLVPVDISDRSLRFTLQPPREAHGTLQDAGLWCAGPVTTAALEGKLPEGERTC